MTRRDRLRRVTLLCCSFVRNLAYYRVGQDDPGKGLLCASHPDASFWRQVNSNCLDLCVLEWCKLFGDERGEHYWRKVVSNKARFEADLLARLDMTQDKFREFIDTMRDYRNKFVAHLDSDPTMCIPKLDPAHDAISFYHEYLISCEIQHGDLAGLADTSNKLSLGYKQCLDEAKRIMLAAATSKTP